MELSDIDEWVMVRCELKDGERSSSTELYRDYLAFHRYDTLNARTTRSHKRLISWLLKHHPVVSLKSGRRYIVGLRLKPVADSS
jgi:hypothetical protein